MSDQGFPDGEGGGASRPAPRHDVAEEPFRFHARVGRRAVLGEHPPRTALEAQKLFCYSGEAKGLSKQPVRRHKVSEAVAAAAYVSA